jgi:hypothetical protein
VAKKTCWEAEDLDILLAGILGVPVVSGASFLARS